MEGSEGWKILERIVKLCNAYYCFVKPGVVLERLESLGRERRSPWVGLPQALIGSGLSPWP